MKGRASSPGPPHVCGHRLLSLSRLSCLSPPTFSGKPLTSGLLPRWNKNLRDALPYGWGINGRGSHNPRRIRIRGGIRSPVWPPERPDADADPWAAKPMEPAKMVEAMVEPVAAEPMPTPPRMPDSRAGEEQRRQHHDNPHPLLPGAQRDSLPGITMSVPCDTRPPATPRETSVASLIINDRPPRA
jgi:hypothetical protein